MSAASTAPRAPPDNRKGAWQSVGDHLAIALGREAIRHGYSVLFTPATALVTTLVRGHAEGRLEQRMAQLAKPKLLIMDEFGYLPFEPAAAHLLFQLISRRYEKGSILITSNRAVGDWGTVLGDQVVATAILDRLLHHSHVLTIRGDSYRLREKRRSGADQSDIRIGIRRGITVAEVAGFSVPPLAGFLMSLDTMPPGVAPGSKRSNRCAKV